MNSSVSPMIRFVGTTAWCDRHQKSEQNQTLRQNRHPTRQPNPARRRAPRTEATSGVRTHRSTPLSAISRLGMFLVHTTPR